MSSLRLLLILFAACLQFPPWLQYPNKPVKLEAQGAYPAGDSSERPAAFIQSEIRKWAKVLKEGNLKAD